MNNVSVPDIKQSIAEQYNLVATNLPGNEKITEIRRKAFDFFANNGFPLKSDEEYKYSGTEKIFKEEILWLPQTENKTKINFDSIRNLNKEVAHIFLVNGILINEESELNFINSPLVICDLQTAALKYPELFSAHYGKNVQGYNDAFAQLNTSMASNGLFIYLPEGTIVNKPLQINNIGTATVNTFFQSHHLIIAEKKSEISIIETYVSSDSSVAYHLNVVNEIFVGANASVNYYRLQNENNKVVQINATQVHQEQNSYFDTNTVTLGGAWLRNNLNIYLKGLYCETHLNGLQILSAQQHVDNHTLVDHQMPHCQSNQLYKGILKDKSTGVFNGKIFVRKDAQKTNAYQSSKNMLLSDDATMNTKPQLEIYADDVKCSHGSSTGQIDQNALFYLRSRALSADRAKAILMYAFAIDVIEKIKIVSYKNYLESLIEKCFE